jgi:hypothetical protein
MTKPADAFTTSALRRVTDLFISSNPWNFTLSCAKIDHRRAEEG